MDKIKELTKLYNYKTLKTENAYKIIEEIRNFFKDKNLVIWGAGISGRFYYQLLKKYNINIRYYIDKNAIKLKTVEDIKVCQPQKLKEENEDIIVIAAGNPSIVNSIMNEAKTINLPSNIHLIEGDSLLSIFKCSDCMLKKINKEKITLTDCSICNNLECDCSAFKELSSLNIENTSGKPDFGMIGYILGQVCTLKCKHCCESVPYIEKPIIVETQQVIKDIQKMANACHTISRLEFIGGEPFLHRGLPEILKAVINTPNIGYALVFTNATVMPSDDLIEILKHPKVVLNFSGYKETLSDELKEKIAKTKAKLIENGVNFAFYNPDSRNWLDINHYEKRDLPDNILKEYHQKCFMYVCHRIFNGEFYGCPHQYSGIQLGKIEKFPYEYIQIHKHSDKELTELLIKFKQLDFTEACRYCNLPYDAEVVPPAIQLTKQEEIKCV